MIVEPRRNRTPHRVVVTGVGLCVPTGPGCEAAWAAAMEARSAVDSSGPGGHPRAPVTGFDPKTVVDRKKALKLMGPNMQFALGAAREAWAASGREPCDPAFVEAGTVLGARVRPGDYDEIMRVAAGSLVDGAFSCRRLGEEGAAAIFPLSMLRNLPNLVTAQVTIQLGLRGFTDTLTSGEVSGLQAVGEAMEVIRRGDAEVVLAGGADDLLDPFSFGSALAEGWVGAAEGGVLLGQGAAMVVLEEREHAVARGARVLAELSGFGESFGPPGDIGANREVLQRALDDAGGTASSVQAVWLDTCRVPGRDEGWDEALQQVFGELEERPWRCGQAARLGHSGAAVGAVELAFAVLALGHGRLPPAVSAPPGAGHRVPGAAVELPAEASMLVASSSLAGSRAAIVVQGVPGA